MTRCASHGDLLGGYVLDALSSEETAAMRAHLGTCAICTAEYAALAGLPGLLDLVEPTDVPPPLPSPRVEEAVLDRFAREHGHGRRRRGRSAGPEPSAADGNRKTSRPQPGDRQTAHSPSRDHDTSRPHTAVHQPGRSRTEGGRFPHRTLLRVAAGVLAALAVAGVALALFLPGSGDEPYASGTLAGTGSGRFTVEQVPSGTRVYLEVDRLDADAYEVWCIRTDGRWISGGSFRPAANGSATATMTAAVQPGDYHEVVVTRGGARGERGPVVMRGDLVY